jgi:hypothetical protein
VRSGRPYRLVPTPQPAVIRELAGLQTLAGEVAGEVTQGQRFMGGHAHAQALAKGILYRYAGHVRDRGVGDAQGLDLGGTDVHAAADDDVLEPADDGEVSLRAETVRTEPSAVR